MLLKADAAQLEWRVKVFLAQDQVAIREIQNDEDLHTDNQNFFKLPNRTIAKIFLYRMIFADVFGDRGLEGPAYAYANDADFMGTSTSVKFWVGVIERFFEKYKGIYEHSHGLIRTAVSTGRITIPSGRSYTYSPKQTWRGMDWPRTEILNHNVQGLSADFMSLARLDLYRKLKVMPEFGKTVLLINTVHDDIETDVDNDPELVYNISIEMRDSFRAIPRLFEQHYGTPVNVPMDSEVKMGWNLHEKQMVKIKEATFKQDWEKLNAI